MSRAPANPRRDESVKRLRLDGYSYRQIAAAVDITRNQVAGILARAGLTDPEAGMFGTGRKRRTPRPKVAYTRSACESAESPGSFSAPQMSSEKLTPKIEPRLGWTPDPTRCPADWPKVEIPPMPAELSGCPYILGEKGQDFERYSDPEAKRCGAETLEDSVYCAEHHALCYHAAGCDGRGKSAAFTFKERF